MPKLHIVCMRPGGYNRGGHRHEGHQVHDLEAFSAAQLREMHNDPHLALIVGGAALTEEQVAAAEKVEADKAEAEQAAAQKAAEAKAPKQLKAQG